MQDSVPIGMFGLRWSPGTPTDGKEADLSFPLAGGSPLDLEWTLPHNNLQGHYGEKFVQLIVAAAGLVVSKPDPDHGWDLQALGAKDLGEDLPEANFKIKSYRSQLGDGQEFPYRLKIKDFNDLAALTRIPRYLIVVAVPEDPRAYFKAGRDVTTLPGSAAYWVSFRGRKRVPELDPESRMTVSVPKCNLLTPEVMLGFCAQGLTPEEVV